MKFSAGRCHSPHQSPPLLFGRFWKASVPRDPKEREGHCSQTIYGGYWNFVGSTNRTSGQMLRLSLGVWKGLRCRHGHLPRRVGLVRGQMRAVLVSFLHFLGGLRLTLYLLCDMTGTSKPGDTPPGEKEEDTNSGCCNCVIM